MRNFFGCACFLLSFFSMLYAQAQEPTTFTVKGFIKDEATGEALIGATVSYEPGKGVTTDTDGNYVLQLPNGEYTLTASFVGYKPMKHKIKVDGRPVVWHFVLASATELNEVEIVADVAKIRETPIAVSNVDAKQIQEELGARDLPMLLNSTPGVYASQQGGGSGDSRVNIRGFDQRNVAVLVDGVPVNDMENGQVYWSNWAGLSEVTKMMQVQRGLGASRLALPSVGGTMNIITQNIDDKRSFVVKNDMGTNNFQRLAIGYNSGIIKNKFGVTLAGSYSSSDGWVDQTWNKAWSYFAKFSYRINSRNMIVLGVNGAPQSHGQRSSQINAAFYNRDYAISQGINADSVYASPSNPYTNSKTGGRGLQYNPDWGYVNGNKVNTRVNFYHKPLMNLSYFLTINDKMTFSNVAYLSIGRGGGTSMANAPSADKNGTGQLLLQDVYNENISLTPNPFIPGMRGTSKYLYATINSHNWVGTLSTLKYQINKMFHFTGGLDLRYYEGIHYQTPTDLLGADYVQEPAGKDKNLRPFIQDPMSYIRKVDDKINYYYRSKETWAGLFAQLEYKSEKITAFVTLTGNQSSMQNINYYNKKDIVFGKDNIARNVVGFGDTLYYDGTNYGVTSNPNNIPGANGITKNADGSLTFMDAKTKKMVTIQDGYKIFTNTSSEARANTTDVKLFYGYTAKGGANYKINDNHNVFVNVGYMSQAPRYSNVYDRSGVELQAAKNQLILSGELGYGVKYSNFAANVNGYITSWGNRPLDYAMSYTDPNTGDVYYYNVPGIDALMKGVELDFSYTATSWAKVNFFGMLADWKWTSGGTAYFFDNGGSLLNTFTFDATNVHLGNAPQRQIGGSIRFEPVKHFYIKPQFTYFDKMYAQFDPSSLTLKTNATTGAVISDYRREDSWLMPGYGLFDLFMGYSMKVQKVGITLNASVNNVFNVIYMTDASFYSVTPNKYSASTAQMFMGMGRRLNVGVKVTF